MYNSLRDLARQKILVGNVACIACMHMFTFVRLHLLIFIQKLFQSILLVVDGCEG